MTLRQTENREKIMALEKMTSMNSIADKLDSRINRMQNERSPFSHRADHADATELAMLQFAAGLKGLACEASGPDAGFISGLRARMLAGVGVASGPADR